VEIETAIIALGREGNFTSNPMLAKPERLIECLLSGEADI
jgi:hypothetical protein